MKKLNSVLCFSAAICVNACEAFPVLSSVSTKVKLDRTFSTIVKTHWNVANTGTPYKIKMRFNMDSHGVVKNIAMENVNANTVLEDNPRDVDPLLCVSIQDAVSKGGREYSANGHPQGHTYIGWFITSRHAPHRVRIFQETSESHD